MNTEEQITLSEFIAKHGITSSCRRVDSNPFMDEDGRFSMNHYLVTLKMAGKRFSVRFSQGLAIRHEPTAADVLDCLAMDASGMENGRGNFEDWAEECGYDTDSRKAEKTFKAIQRQAAKLLSLLGEEAYSELLWNTERL